MRKKIWSSATADRKIREFVFKRDGYKCVFCKRSREQGWKIEPSHYWGRADSALRYELDNIDTLCAKCHMDHEPNKQGFYREWKIKQLGIVRYEEMERIHYQESIPRREAIIRCMEFLTTKT